MGILSTHRRMMTIDGLSAVSVMHAGRLGALAYKDKVLGYGPIAYWMLAEAAGATAIDQIDSPAQDGTHSGVTLGQTGIGDGETCPLYDGLASNTNIYSVPFRDAFNGAECTLLAWVKVSGAGVWTDGNTRHAVGIRSDTGDQFLYLRKGNGANQFFFIYQAGGVNQSRVITISSTDWFTIAVTLSKTVDQMRVYLGGVQQGATLTGLGVWTGKPHVTRTRIGSYDAVEALFWDGWLAHCAVWDTALSGPDILDVSTL